MPNAQEDDRNMVSFDKLDLARFKFAYEKALEKWSKLNPSEQYQIGFMTFDFDGLPYVMSYAKYLIEYLESRLKE